MFGVEDCTVAGGVNLDLRGDTYSRGCQSMPRAITWSSVMTTQGQRIKTTQLQVWWLTPVIPGLGRWRQKDSHELEANMGYIVSFRMS